MWNRGFGVVLGMSLLGVLACKSESRSLAAADTTCQVPCQDDPSKTCTVPCPTIGSAAGKDPVTGGAGGAGGAGGSGGSGGAVTSVDISGTVLQVTSVTFDAVAPYLDALTVIAPGVDTAEVQAEAVGGAFVLIGAASGPQWVLAKELDGVGGAFSTYTIQDLNGKDPIGLPVVPVDILETIATQIDVQSLIGGRAHLVLEVDDVDDKPIEGAALALKDASIGYAVGPGQWSAAAGETGTLGLVAAMNVPMAAPSMVNVTLDLNGALVTVPVQMAPDTATYSRVVLDLTP